MNRPYLFCHMMMSVDGKIMGNYMDTPACEKAGRSFDGIAFGKQGNVMSVPCLVINEDQVVFGKKNIEQILDLL